MATTKRRTKQPKPARKPRGPGRGKPSAPKSKPRKPGRTKASSSKGSAKAPKKRGGSRKRNPKITGRPSRITEHIKVVLPTKKGKKTTTMTVGNAVVAVLASGCSVDTAASIVGVGRTTIYDWIAKGQEVRGLASPTADQRAFSDFSDAVTRARESVVQFALAGVLEAGKSDWRALAWFLERSRPDEFGRRTRFELGDGAGGALTLAELIASASKDPSTAHDADDPDLQ